MSNRSSDHGPESLEYCRTITTHSAAITLHGNSPDSKTNWIISQNKTCIPFHLTLSLWNVLHNKAYSSEMDNAHCCLCCKTSCMCTSQCVYKRLQEFWYLSTYVVVNRITDKSVLTREKIQQSVHWVGWNILPFLPRNIRVTPSQGFHGNLETAAVPAASCKHCLSELLKYFPEIPEG